MKIATIEFETREVIKRDGGRIISTEKSFPFYILYDGKLPSVKNLIAIWINGKAKQI